MLNFTQSFNLHLRYFKIDGVEDASLRKTLIKNYDFEKALEQPILPYSVISYLPEENLLSTVHSSGKISKLPSLVFQKNDGLKKKK